MQFLFFFFCMCERGRRIFKTERVFLCQKINGKNVLILFYFRFSAHYFFLFFTKSSLYPFLKKLSSYRRIIFSSEDQWTKFTHVLFQMTHPRILIKSFEASPSRKAFRLYCLCCFFIVLYLLHLYQNNLCSSFINWMSVVCNNNPNDLITLWKITPWDERNSQQLLQVEKT